MTQALLEPPIPRQRVADLVEQLVRVLLGVNLRHVNLEVVEVLHVLLLHLMILFGRQ